MFGSHHGFWRRRGETRLSLTPTELSVLQSLVAPMEELLTPESSPAQDPLQELLDIDSAASTPDDPALLRLLPDAYRDDDEAATDFRRFTERELRGQKLQRLEVVGAVVARILEQSESDDADVVTGVLSEEEVTRFLPALNDMRLVLGSRLGIVADDQDVTADWDHDDPRHAQHDVYQWLTWLQSTLLAGFL